MAGHPPERPCRLQTSEPAMGRGVGGGKSEVVDLCFSALIHVESEFDSRTGFTAFTNIPAAAAAPQQYSLKCTKCVSQKKKKVQFFTTL